MDVEHDPIVDRVGGRKYVTQLYKTPKPRSAHNLEPTQESPFAVWMSFPEQPERLARDYVHGLDCIAL